MKNSNLLNTNLENLLRDLITFESDKDHSEEIKKCFNFAVGYLKKAGLKVKTYSSNGRPSLIAARKLKKHYQFILNGHLDVVPASYPNAFNPLTKRDKFYGRGAGDMKGTVAVMIKLFEEPKLKNVDMALVLTTDEEIGGENGVKYLLEKESLSCDCAIVPDGGENFILILAEKGVLHIKVEAKGIAAHGSRPWLGDNAINKLIRIYENICRSFPKLTAPDYWQPTVNLGVLKGGDATNKVPNYAFMQLDFRFPDIEDEKAIINYINKEVAREKDTKYEITSRGFPLINDSKNPFFQKIINCAKKEGINLDLKKEHGASDGRFFSERKIPVIMFKPVCGGSHIDNEWIDFKSLEKFYQLLKTFLLS